MSNLKTGFVYINGTAFPYPSYESGLQHAITVVDGARMADGVFRGKKIGRDQMKIEMKWPILTPEQWSSMCRIFDQSFTFQLRYFDMVYNTWRTRTCYVGDRKAQPFLVGDDGRPKYWRDCQANVIDTGEGE